MQAGKRTPPPPRRAASRLATATAILLWCSTHASGQTVVTQGDIYIDTHWMGDVGDTLPIQSRDRASSLPPGRYTCNYQKKSNTYPIHFTINAAGRPDGVVDCPGSFKTWVRDGVIYRYEQYYRETGAVAEEIYAGGDTITTVRYTGDGRTKAKNIKVARESIYEHNCGYDDASGPGVHCQTTDYTAGLYVVSENGVVRERSRTKGLPAGISSQKEEFLANGKLDVKTIVYADGRTKTVARDGSYTIRRNTESGEIVEQYSKGGKLIESHRAIYPTIH